MKKEKMTRVVTIDTQLHDDLKEFCNRNGLKIQFVAREGAKEVHGKQAHDAIRCCPIRLILRRYRPVANRTVWCGQHPLAVMKRRSEG